MTDAQTIASRFIEALNDRDFDTLSRLVRRGRPFDLATGGANASARRAQTG